MPHPLPLPQPALVERSDFGIAEGQFVFLFMFDAASAVDRKNPLAVIRAFRRAFSENDNVTLLVKASRAQSDPEGYAQLQAAASGAKIVIFDEVMSRERALGLVQMCDCYVSLHRSEGFGLTMAEAMALGKPVIATRYSGNLDFMREENSFLVDYAVVPVETSGPNYRCGGGWAEPSVDHAAELMRAVWSDPGSAAERAARGRSSVLAELAPETIGRRMRSRLEQILSGALDAPNCRQHL
jgi:glycosyltransferase involved in cell wall biosynthesis